MQITSQKLIKGVLVILFGALLVSACSGAMSSDSGYVPEPPEMPAEEYYDTATGFDSEGRTYSGEATLANYQETQSQDRLVIKDANLAIVVGDPSGTMDEIARLADSMDGYVVSANLYQVTTSDGISVPEGMIVIRVPAEKMNEAVEVIKSQSDRDPLQESISSQDVTSEYVDLQSRLRNLEAAEEQLIGIMDEASKIEDVLAVYSELVRVQEEIEVIKGRMQYLEQSAAMSSISTELIADEAVQPLTIGGWEPVGVVKNAVQALINALKFLVNAGIWILILVVPILLILTLFVFLPGRWLVRRLRGRRDQNKEKVDRTDTSEKPGE